MGHGVWDLLNYWLMIIVFRYLLPIIKLNFNELFCQIKLSVFIKVSKFFRQLISGSLQYTIKTKYVGKLETSECIAIRIYIYIYIFILNTYSMWSPTFQIEKENIWICKVHLALIEYIKTVEENNGSNKPLFHSKQLPK